MAAGAAMWTDRVSELDIMLEETKLLIKKIEAVREQAKRAKDHCQAVTNEDLVARVGGLIAGQEVRAMDPESGLVAIYARAPSHADYTSRNSVFKEFHLHLKAGVRTLVFSDPTTYDAKCITLVEAVRQFGNHAYRLGDDIIHHREAQPLVQQYLRPLCCGWVGAPQPAGPTWAEIRGHLRRPFPHINTIRCPTMNFPAGNRAVAAPAPDRANQATPPAAARRHGSPGSTPNNSDSDVLGPLNSSVSSITNSSLDDLNNFNSDSYISDSEDIDIDNI